MTFRVIMADPPWKYASPRALVGNRGRGSNGGQAARIKQVDVEAQYTTMTVAEIAALDVASLADPAGCMLFLWVTNPFLADGSGPHVVKAWGFRPVTVLTWAKTQLPKRRTTQSAMGTAIRAWASRRRLTPSMRTGHWFRSASEHCIVGVRGNVRRPAKFPALPTWQPSPRIGKHSAKPAIFHEYAERAVPGGPWLELFARNRRPGWIAIGDQFGSSVETFIERGEDAR